MTRNAEETHGTQTEASTVHAKALEIAEHLGPDWSCSLPEDTTQDAHRATLHGPGGLTVGIFRFHPHQRGQFFGVLPTSDFEGYMHVPEKDRGRITIYMKLERPAAHLARDIERRLLPNYREVLATVQERIRDIDAYHRASDAGARKLARLAGVGYRERDRYQREYKVLTRLGYIQVHGDDVSLRLHGLTLDQAERTLELFQEFGTLDLPRG